MPIIAALAEPPSYCFSYVCMLAWFVKVVKLKNDINLKFKDFSKNDNLFEIWKHLRIQNQLQKFI